MKRFEGGGLQEVPEIESEAEMQEAIMRERIGAAMAIPDNYPDRDAAWQAERMMEILQGKLHAVHEEPEKPQRMRGNLGEAWDV